MKKYIVVAMLGLMLFPTMSYAKCCDFCKENPPKINRRAGVGTISAEFVNTREYTGIEKLIGKMIYRTVTNDRTDKSFMYNPRKLLAVTDEYLILSSDDRFEIEQNIWIKRDNWDDGNWEEVTKKLLIVTEITISNSFPLTFGVADKYCVRCGKKLRYILHGNYYCGSCKTGFNIKEE